jgi:hypothetical protein
VQQQHHWAASLAGRQQILSNAEGGGEVGCLPAGMPACRPSCLPACLPGRFIPCGWSPFASKLLLLLHSVAVVLLLSIWVHQIDRSRFWRQHDNYLRPLMIESCAREAQPWWPSLMYYMGGNSVENTKIVHFLA